MKRWTAGLVAAVSAAILGVAPGLAVSGGAGLAAGHRPIIRLRQGTSSNWSGYAAHGGSFSTVSGSWIQPLVSCTSQNTYSSYWVGLDGYNTPTVEQLGTEGDCVNGAPSYYAWFEMYPRGGRVIAMKVWPGDHFQASVTALGRGLFSLSLADHSTGASFTTTQKLMAAQRASAEVIVEAPSSGGVLPLANFTRADFTAATANGTALGGFGPNNLDPITMVNPYGMKATPSGFDATLSSFSVAWSGS
jgi:hypothetical protein